MVCVYHVIVLIKEVNFIYPTLYVNTKTYESVIKTLGYKPTNLKVNKYLPYNQALFIDGGNNDENNNQRQLLQRFV